MKMLRLVLRNKIDRAMGDAVKFFFSCYFLLSFVLSTSFQLCIQLINNNKDCSIYVNYTTRKSFQQIKNKLTIIIPVLIYNIH